VLPAAARLLLIQNLGVAWSATISEAPHHSALSAVRMLTCPRPVRSWNTRNSSQILMLPWYVTASSNMAYRSPAKIYGAQPPGPADQASTLSGPAATDGSGFTASFEFARPAENVAVQWSSQPLNALDLSPPNEDPWSQLRTRGGRTHSCDAKMMQPPPAYVSGGALSDCGTLLSRHAVSDSAYAGSRLSNNLINSTRFRAGRVAGRNVPPARLSLTCIWKDCGKSFKCRSDHRYVAASPGGPC
jgi:hypothetical protein